MSDALKRLDEIEARLKAATPGPWEWQDWRDRDDPDFGQWRSSLAAPPETRPDYPGMFPTLPNRVLSCEEPPENQGDAALIANAPADLALLARLVRSVAEASCTAYLHPRGCSVGFPRAVNTYTWPNPEDWWRDHACIPCKVRRELSGGVR